MVTEYYAAPDLGSLFVGLGVFVLLVVFACWWSRTYNYSKSKCYRKYLANLYVSGRILQEAKKDSVNIDEVEKNFLKYEKLSNKRRIMDLDDKIEQELMDKIENSKSTSNKKEKKE